MRAGIGLISLLVGVALMMWLFAESEIPKVKAGKKAQEEAQQISGRGTDSLPAMESFETEAQRAGSRMTLVVTAVTPGGAMQTYYGLLKDDRITGVNGMHVNDLANGDDQLAKALVAEAFGKQQKLAVVRNGQTLTLPLPPGSPPAGTAPAAGDGAVQQPAPTEAPTQPPAPREGNSVAEQLQKIQDAAGGAGADQE